MTAPLLHLTTPPEWRAALDAGVIAPPSLAEVGFVHLSTREQVALPANRIFAGRHDLVLLVLDPARIGVGVRWEPGVASDPESMRFPHAYGPVPTVAVLVVLPYRPDSAGSFTAPAIPTIDAAGRIAGQEPSLLRRVATTEIPVTGGVAVLADPVPLSHQHNQLLIDGAVRPEQLFADAERTLGGAGRGHRKARLAGAHQAPTAAALRAAGWEVEEVVGMAVAAGGPGADTVEQVDLDALRPMWAAMWRHDVPDMGDAAITQLADRYLLEAAVLDLRHLAVRMGGEVVASCLLKLDGATAEIDSLNTLPDHRGRGFGDALFAEARALAAAAGCDLVGLQADANDWPRHWYARRGCTEVSRSWGVQRPV